MAGLTALSAYLPHFLVILGGWFMTLSPGTLFFHKLQTFEVFEHATLELTEDPQFSVTAAEMLNVPYIRSFFYALSMPCFGLIYFALSFFRQDPQPDVPLFVIALAPTAIACWKITAKKRSLFLAIAFLNAVLAVPVCQVLIHFNFFDMDWAVPGMKQLVYALVLVQFLTLSTAVTTCGLDYYRYTNPRASMLDYKACYETLRKIYSTGANIAVCLWHHCDLAVVALYIAVWRISSAFSDHVLILGSLVSILMTLPATKFILQLRMIDLMLPCFTRGNSRKQDIRGYIKPIGAIAFGTVASASSQAMFLIAWLYCLTFIPHDIFYGKLLRMLLLSGTILNGTAKILSLFLFVHPMDLKK